MDMSKKPGERIIALVGLMGAGKSCIGRRLAASLHLPFIDADREIEQAAGCSVADFFAIHGEAAFREGEKKVIRRLLNREPHVLATGGGAYLDPDTRKLMKEKAVTIWLKADLDLLLRRVQRRTDRPLLQDVDPRAKLADLMKLRYPLYAQADIIVESIDGPPEATLEEVLKELKARDALAH